MFYLPRRLGAEPSALGRLGKNKRRPNKNRKKTKPFGCVYLIKWSFYPSVFAAGATMSGCRVPHRALYTWHYYEFWAVLSLKNSKHEVGLGKFSVPVVPTHPFLSVGLKHPPPPYSSLSLSLSKNLSLFSL